MSLVYFFWQKDNTENIPTSRNKKPPKNINKTIVKKQNWKTCSEQTLHQNNNIIAGKTAAFVQRQKPNQQAQPNPQQQQNKIGETK